MKYIFAIVTFTLASCMQPPAPVENHSKYISENSSAMPAAYAQPVMSVESYDVAALEPVSYVERNYDDAENMTRPQAAVQPRPTALKPVSAEYRDKALGHAIKVEKGQTLSHISHSYGIPQSELVKINGLNAPYEIRAGQTIYLPYQTYHTVTRGQTLWQISREFDVSIESLVHYNDLQPPYYIKEGQKIAIPVRGAGKSVRRGRAGVNASTAREARRIKPVRLASRPVSMQEDYIPFSVTSGGKATEELNAEIGGYHAVMDKPIPGQKRRSLSPPGHFSWPVRGQVISSFGAKDGGVHNDGINISAKEGGYIKAAADGEVVYTSDALKGYGNLIILRHGGGWLTAYAHTGAFRVRKGQYVKRGQEIARVGKSGNVKTPQVHFAIRKGRVAVNPLHHLSG